MYTNSWYDSPQWCMIGQIGLVMAITVNGSLTWGNDKQQIKIYNCHYLDCREDVFIPTIWKW